MKYDMEALAAPPPEFCHLGAFGLEKRGKTTFVMKVAMVLAHKLGKKIALVDAENMRGDWHRRVTDVLGAGSLLQFPAPINGQLQIPTPEQVLDFVRWCEQQDNPPIVVIDSMTVLQSVHRKAYIEKNKKIPLNAYMTIDKPYKDLGDYLQGAQLHWLTTFRESDDKQEIDGDEKVVGKKGKAGGFEYIPRILTHHTLARGKGSTKFVTEIRDCSKGGVTRIVKSDSEGEVKASDLQPLLARFIGEAE